MRVFVSREAWSLPSILLDLVLLFLLLSCPLLHRLGARSSTTNCRLDHPRMSWRRAPGPGEKRRKGKRERAHGGAAKGREKRTVHGARAKPEQRGDHQAARGDP